MSLVLVGMGGVYQPRTDPTRTRCAPVVGFLESARGFGPRDIWTSTPGDGGLLAPVVFDVGAGAEYRHDPGAVPGTRKTVEPNTWRASDNVKYLQTVRMGVRSFAADAAVDRTVTVTSPVPTPQQDARVVPRSRRDAATRREGPYARTDARHTPTGHDVRVFGSRSERPMTPEEVVRAEMGAWSSLDVDQIMAYFTDDATWLPGFSFPTYSGLKAIREAVDGFVNDMEKADIEIVNLAVAGNVVLTERVDHFIFKGRRLDAPGMGAFEISGDKIAAWRDYFASET